MAGTGESRPSGPPPCRIAVVDDDPDATEALAEFLVDLGHDAKTAHDGLAALELVRTYDPAVVILDVRLPGLDGLEVARRLRRERGASIILIALTGFAQDEDRQLTREAGFDHHLVKPLSLDSLAATIDRLRAARR